MYHFAYENTFFDKFKLFIGAEIYITVAQPRVEVTKLIFIVLTAEKYQSLSFFSLRPKISFEMRFRHSGKHTVIFDMHTLLLHAHFMCENSQREITENP